MKNYVMNTIGCQKRVRIIVAELSNLIDTIKDTYIMEKPLMQGFCELMATLSLMSGPMDLNERIYVKLLGDISTAYMIGGADGTGEIRGFVGDHFKVCNIGADIFGKKGSITVSRDSGIGIGYSGMVEMIDHSIAKNLQYYYNQSEQLPTWIKVFLKEETPTLARGIMVQLLPGEPAAFLHEIQELITAYETSFADPAWKLAIENLQEIIPDLTYMSEKPLKMQCSCTKEQYYGLIFALSAQEVQTIIQQKEILHAVCSRCGKQYDFSDLEIMQLRRIT